MVPKLWTWATVWTVLNSGTAMREIVVRESKKVRVWLKAGSDTGQKDCVTVTCWGMGMRRHDFSRFRSYQVHSSSLKGTGRDPRTSEARGWGSPLSHGQPWPCQTPRQCWPFPKQGWAEAGLGLGTSSCLTWRTSPGLSGWACWAGRVLFYNGPFAPPCLLPVDTEKTPRPRAQRWRGCPQPVRFKWKAPFNCQLWGHFPETIHGEWTNNSYCLQRVEGQWAGAFSWQGAIPTWRGMARGPWG